MNNHFISKVVCFLFFTCMSLSIMAQQTRTIRGKVLDEQSEPIPGATISIRGTNIGTISNTDGDFTLGNVPANQQTVQISSIGYLAQIVDITNKSEVVVNMVPSTSDLDEVVVIGYGTVKRRDLTGSVTTIKPDVILATPTANVMTALQGRVPGLDISGNNMVMRGHRSIDGGNDPLVIIDGVMGGRYQDINPADIASIDVLKDASSTAIYGSLGANGVIIITTRAPDKGKMSLSYHTYSGITQRADENPRRVGESWLAPRRIAAQNAGIWASALDDASLFSNPEAYEAFMRNEWTDYRELIQRTPFFTNHTLSLSGGTDNTNVRMTFGWEKNLNRNKGATSDNYNLRTVVNQKLFDWLSAGVNFRLSHDNTINAPVSGGGWQLGTPYDENGELILYPVGQAGYVNPLWNTQANLNVGRSYNTRVNASAFLDIKPMKELSIRSTVNTNLAFGVSGSYVDKNSSGQINGNKTSTATFTMTPSRYLEWNNVATYEKKMEDHRISVTGITAYTKRMSERLSGSGRNQLVAANLWYVLGATENQSVGSASYRQRQTLSYAGRLDYGFKGRYLLTATVRWDGSSLLAKGHQWDYFPSAALAWRVSDEEFMKGTQDWLDNLKLRLTYGVTGNSGTEEYGTQSGVVGYTTTLGLQDIRLLHYDFNGVIGNTETGWEKSKQVNLAADFSLFRSRLSGTVELYNTNTFDLLLERMLPSTSGSTPANNVYTIRQNIGKTNNKGIEVTLSGFPIKTKDFSWKTTLTFARNKEKIVDLIDGNDIAVQVTGTNATATFLMIGHPINSYKTYQYLGIWTEAEKAEAATYFKNEAKTEPFVPGDYKILDRNGDKVITQEGDWGYVGSSTPDWFAGFDHNFRYKNFDLNVYFFFRWGHWGSNPLSGVSPSTGDDSTLPDKWFYHAETNNGSGAKLPPLYAGYGSSSYHGYEALYYCDRSFFKIKNASLGYTLPKSFLHKAKVQNCRVYFSMANPWYYAKSFWLEGIDPEGSSRNYVLGLELSF